MTLCLRHLRSTPSCVFTTPVVRHGNITYYVWSDLLSFSSGHKIQSPHERRRSALLVVSVRKQVSTIFLCSNFDSNWPYATCDTLTAVRSSHTECISVACQLPSILKQLLHGFRPHQLLFLQSTSSISAQFLIWAHASMSGARGLYSSYICSVTVISWYLER